MLYTFFFRRSVYLVFGHTCASFGIIVIPLPGRPCDCCICSITWTIPSVSTSCSSHTFSLWTFDFLSCSHASSSSFSLTVILQPPHTSYPFTRLMRVDALPICVCPFFRLRLSPCLDAVSRIVDVVNVTYPVARARLDPLPPSPPRCDVPLHDYPYSLAVKSMSAVLGPPVLIIASVPGSRFAVLGLCRVLLVYTCPF